MFKYLVQGFKKFLLQALVTLMESVIVVLLSMMALGDVRCELFRICMLFISFQVFYRSVIFFEEKLVK